MRHAAGMARRAAAGEPCYREIKTAPEEMHRARLAEEAGAEFFEHPVGVQKYLEEPSHRVRIVGRVVSVLRELGRLRQFVRHLVDRNSNAEFAERGHDGPIETRDR